MPWDNLEEEIAEEFDVYVKSSDLRINIILHTKRLKHNQIALRYWHAIGKFKRLKYRAIRFCSNCRKDISKYRPQAKACSDKCSKATYWRTHK